MVKRILSCALAILLVLGMVGCSSNNNDNPSTEKDNQTNETNSDKVNEYGIKESDMQDLYATIKSDMLVYFKEKGIDPQTFEWPDKKETDLDNYWIIIGTFFNEYDALIQYDDMSLEKIQKEFEDYYKDKYFKDDTQLLMYKIAISIVNWTNNHKDVQEKIFMLPSDNWATYLPENIDFSK